MAAKRIFKHSFNWEELSDRVPSHQRALYQEFKSISDRYLRRVQELPEKPPEIDWAYYKAKIPVPGMVEEFQKKYADLKIPYPVDTVSPQVDAQEQLVKKDVETHKAESMARIQDKKKQMAHLASLIPYDQMTLEDYRDAFPEDAIDPIKKPTFWPHNPEEQVGYDGGKPESSGH